jgi:hypothetical protein
VIGKIKCGGAFEAKVMFSVINPNSGYLGQFGENCAEVALATHHFAEFEQIAQSFV